MNVTHYALHYLAVCPAAFAMAPNKTATLNLRIDPILKEVVRLAAERSNRSIANLIEVLIREHCEREGIPVPKQGDMFQDGDRG